MKNIRIFLFENFHFLVLKFSVYMNRHVFVMELIGQLAQRYLYSCVTTGFETRAKFCFLSDQ